jgi:serine/threonine protein kinase
MPLSPGQILNNRYRIDRLLGRGGFGTLYYVWDINLESPRALKENLDTSPEAQRQFKREAQILDKLAHPNLPRVLDHFVVPEQGQYLVMDFVEGEDLQEKLVKADGPLPEAQVLEWIGQICDALTYLHSQKPPVIHRDIKPANIRITPDGKAMLVDFGIAKIYDPDLGTTRGARAITSGYSPPEQYGRGLTDAQSDIYALGATCYHLLTGQIPPDSVDILNNTDAAPLPVNQLNHQVTPQVSAAIARAMQPNRELRWQSVADFKAALTTLPGGEPAFVTSSFSAASGAASPPPTVPHGPPPASVPPTMRVAPRDRRDLLIMGVLALFALGILCSFGMFVLYRWQGAEQAALHNRQTFESMLATGVVSMTPAPDTPLTPTLPPPGGTPVSVIPTIPSPTLPLPPSMSTPPPANLPGPTPAVYMFTPDQIIRVYYDAINQRNYDLSWSILSDHFKKKYNSTGFGPYVAWWDTVAEMEILQLDIREQQDDSSAVIFVGLRYHYLDGRVVDDNYLFTLIAWPGQYGWQIDSYR